MAIRSLKSSKIKQIKAEYTPDVSEIFRVEGSSENIDHKEQLQNVKKHAIVQDMLCELALFELCK